MADVKPRGYAATAAEFLDEAAADGDGRNLAVRQLAALQGIGYGLLALGDQLADLTDASADHAGQLGQIAGALDGLAVTQPGLVLASFRRACEALRGRIGGGVR